MIGVENVCKTYHTPQGEVRALDGVSLTVQAGEFVAVRGPSGSGKTTLLLTIAGMVHPTSGRVRVDDTDIYALSGRRRATFRATHIGFVFQMFHLVPYLTVQENALVPTIAAGQRPDRARAAELLERVGMSARALHRPAQLSAGERQRAAIARALMNHPALILADEPTGNLDPDRAGEVMGYLAEFHQAGGTIVLVTHEEVAAQYAQRTVSIRDGHVVPPSGDSQ